MPRKILAVAIALMLAGTVQAAEENLAQVEAKPAATPTKPAAPKRAPVRADVRQGEEDLLARTVYQALLGELALRGGEVDLGVSAWADLARRTQDPKVLARATEVAGLARQYDLAVELAEMWVSAEPESTKARQAQSTLLLLGNRLDELAPQLAELLARDPASLAANLMHLNRMLARHADKKAVRNLVDRVVSPHLPMPEAYFAMAQAASNAGDDAASIAAVEQALAHRPNWEAAALLRAQGQARQSVPLAIEGLQAFLKTAPKALDARLTLARLLINDKRFTESRAQLDLLIKEVPDNPEVIYPLAMLALQQGDTDIGRAQLEHLLETGFTDKSTVHFFLGQLDEEKGKVDAALAHYAKVLAGDQLIAARTRSAALLQKRGQINEALAVLASTRGATARERTQLLLAEAQLLREASRLHEAFLVLEAGLKAQPENLDLLYESAMIADRLGRYDVLEQNLKRLLEIDPDHAHGLNALGYSWADRNIRVGEAEKLIAKALALAPEDPFIMDSMGWVYFRQGRLNEALVTLEKAFSLRADPEIAAHLGEVLWLVDRKDEARRILSEAAKQHPDNEVLASVIKKLQL
jgi:tetratricopeptide (TPR) repeat protein